MGLIDLFFKALLPGRSTVSSKAEDKIKSDWTKVLSLQKLGGPSNLRQALIFADRCLDTALRDVVQGETMGERLKEARNKFDRYLYDDIWSAHKVRNALVHESGYEPPYFVINKSLEDFKRALEALGVRI